MKPKRPDMANLVAAQQEANEWARETFRTTDLHITGDEAAFKATADAIMAALVKAWAQGWERGWEGKP